MCERPSRRACRASVVDATNELSLCPVVQFEHGGRRREPARGAQLSHCIDDALQCRSDVEARLVHWIGPVAELRVVIVVEWSSAALDELGTLCGVSPPGRHRRLAPPQMTGGEHIRVGLDVETAVGRAPARIGCSATRPTPHARSARICASVKSPHHPRTRRPERPPRTPRLRWRQTPHPRPDRLPRPQRRRTPLQPDQELARTGHPPRQTRRPLPRRQHPGRSPHVATAKGRHAIGPPQSPPRGQPRPTRTAAAIRGLVDDS